MCWNATVSLGTFLFATFVSGLATITQAIPTVNILASYTFASMQLVEYFLWKTLSDPDANAFYSKIGLGVLILEPITSIVRIRDPKYKMITLSLFGVFTITFFTVHPLGSIDFSTHEACNGHLAWHFLDISPAFAYTFSGFLGAHILFNEPLYYALPLFLFGYMGLLWLSIQLYWDSGTYGSNWCFVSNVLYLGYLYKVVEKVTRKYITLPYIPLLDKV